MRLFIGPGPWRLAGVPLRDAQILARHSDPRTTEHYDRGRGSVERHAIHFLTANVAGAQHGRLDRRLRRREPSNVDYPATCGRSSA
jgi:hypothetical protein